LLTSWTSGAQSTGIDPFEHYAARVYPSSQQRLVKPSKFRTRAESNDTAIIGGFPLRLSVHLFFARMAHDHLAIQ
jgi:hypothetical protein